MRTLDRPKNIALADCLHGRLYRIDSRNLTCVGLFDSELQGFYGIRSKWGSRFIDTELHWDAFKYGTASPWELLPDLPPPEMTLTIYCEIPPEAMYCGSCKTVIYQPQNSVRWRHVVGLSPCREAIPVSIQNNVMFDWLEEMTLKYRLEQT